MLEAPGRTVWKLNRPKMTKCVCERTIDGNINLGPN